MRVIAATNRDLQAAIDAGTFRSDLYYRLNVIPIEMPPLRDRREDIPLLVEYFIDRYASKAGKKIRGINRATLDRLKAYAWPGNIRELQNVIERSVMVCVKRRTSGSMRVGSFGTLTPPTKPVERSSRCQRRLGEKNHQGGAGRGSWPGVGAFRCCSQTWRSSSTHSIQRLSSQDQQRPLQMA